MVKRIENCEIEARASVIRGGRGRGRCLAALAALLLSAAAISGCGGTATSGGSEGAAEAPAVESSVSDGAAEEKGIAAEADGTATEAGAEASGTEAAGGQAEAAPAEEPQKDGDVLVLFTSDVHCGVNQNFGYVGLEAVKEAREAAGDHVLLVDDGDSIQGEFLGSFSKGEADIRLMNALKYDVAIPGNHEFDYGMDRFLELTKLAEFPYVCCNLRREGKPVFEPYVIKESGGLRIAFVGITTPTTIAGLTPKFFQDSEGNFIYNFLDEETGEELYGAVQEAVDAARAEGVDYVVALAHLGNEEICRPWTYVDVISHTTGIDALLDGHSHDTDGVKVKNKDGIEVPRQACGTKMNGIGWLRIEADDGELETGLYSWNNTVPAPELLGIENRMSAVVEAETAGLEEMLSEVVAHTPVPLLIHDPEAKDEAGQPIRIVRRTETNLGDLCADALRIQMGADIALVNGGAIRADIQPGDITRKDMTRVFPYENMMAMVEATGQQILDALEWGAVKTPEQNGSFFQVSGLSYEIHTDLPSTCTSDENGMFTGVTGAYRVQNVMVGEEPLQLDKVYRVASNDYILLNNGDGNTSFSGCKVLESNTRTDTQLLVSYITENLGGTIGEEYADPYGQGRIVAVEASK